MKKDTLICLGIILTILVAGFLIGWNTGKRILGRLPISTETKTDTVIVRDTIKDILPVPYIVKEVRKDTVLLPVVKVINDTTSADSVAVSLPIVQNEYTHDTYHAWVSGGYFASLDSIKVFPEKTFITKTITNTVTEKQSKRWGISLQAGYGYNGRNFAPYIGVGLSYSIICW